VQIGRGKDFITSFILFSFCLFKLDIMKGQLVPVITSFALVCTSFFQVAALTAGNVSHVLLHRNGSELYKPLFLPPSNSTPRFLNETGRETNPRVAAAVALNVAISENTRFVTLESLGQQTSFNIVLVGVLVACDDKQLKISLKVPADLECLARTVHAVAATVYAVTATSFVPPKSAYPTVMRKPSADDALQQAKANVP
jgi:hypothetical protein